MTGGNSVLKEIRWFIVIEVLERFFITVRILRIKISDIDHTIVIGIILWLRPTAKGERHQIT